MSNNLYPTAVNGQEGTATPEVRTEVSTSKLYLAFKESEQGKKHKYVREVEFFDYICQIYLNLLATGRQEKEAFSMIVRSNFNPFAL